jgi:uncharacterized protein (DUF1330 family)
MIYITQLIYINEGMEAVFDQFEAVAIPIIAKYGGELLLRTRPGLVVQAGAGVPNEIHLVSFPSDEQFERFKLDDGRRAFLHLKEQSIKKIVLIKGEML